MSLTASLVPAAGSSIRVMKTRSSRDSPLANSVSLLQPRAGELALDHRGEQALDVGIAGGPDPARVIRLPPLDDGPLLGELVEVGARHRELEPRVLRLALCDLRPGDPHPVDLHIPATPELQAHHELQAPERGDLPHQVPDRDGDQLRRPRHPSAGPAAAEATSFAIPASRSERSPASFIRAAFRVRRRAASNRVPISASLKVIAWCWAIGFPKAFRSWLYRRASSIARWATPTPRAATLTLPTSRASIIWTKPWPIPSGPPRTRSSGTLKPSKT